MTNSTHEPGSLSEQSDSVPSPNRLLRIDRFLRFALIGGLGFVINALGVEAFNWLFEQISLFERLPLVNGSSAVAAAMAAELAIISNFLLNNVWTFASSNEPADQTRLIIRFLKFNLISGGAVLLQFVAVGVATRLIGDTVMVRQVTLLATVALLVVPLNWVLYNLVVWRDR